MYQISDEHIEYIVSDLEINGIENEDLLNNLVDHICCILEQSVTNDNDFKECYHNTVRSFYKNKLQELEEETNNLLTFKNYYAMKKVMISAGAVSVFVLAFGSLFKTMHWPGANILLFSGIVLFSLLFLPLLFILKIREVNTARDKAVIAISSFVGILFCIATLFTFMHWPGANVMRMTSIGLSAFVLLPVYFFTGIRKPETRLNTIMISVILAGVTSLLFAMVNLRTTTVYEDIRISSYQLNESLLAEMRAGTVAPENSTALTERINTLCEQIKDIELSSHSGRMLVKEGLPAKAFFNEGKGVQLIAQLQAAVTEYNNSTNKKPLPVANSVLDAPLHNIGHLFSNVSLLNSITQIQLYLAGTNNKTSVAKE